MLEECTEVHLGLIFIEDITAIDVKHAHEEAVRDKLPPLDRSLADVEYVPTIEFGADPEEGALFSKKEVEP
jgi:hypothetical protein